MPNSGLREPFSRTYCSDDIPDLRRAPVAQWAAIAMARLPAGPGDPESAINGIAVESSSMAAQIRSPLASPVVTLVPHLRVEAFACRITNFPLWATSRAP
jgi:hypothetical protein